MKLAALALAAVILAAAPAAAAMYRYEDETGAVNFVDDPAKIPERYRAAARTHEPQAESAADRAAAATAFDPQALAKKRLAIIATYTPAQAEAALAKGLLTTDEVNYLVQAGALRTAAAGDAVRKSKVKVAPKPTAPPPEPGLVDAELQMLQELGAGRSGGRAGQLVAFVRDNPKAKYAAVGEAAFGVALLVALPFILRRYHSDSARLIKTSLFLAFVMITATVNLLLFKDDLALLLSAGKPGAAAQSPTPPAAATPAPGSE
jgi:hypothetical protein